MMTGKWRLTLPNNTSVVIDADRVQIADDWVVFYKSDTQMAKIYRDCVGALSAVIEGEEK